MKTKTITVRAESTSEAFLLRDLAIERWDAAVAILFDGNIDVTLTGTFDPERAKIWLAGASAGYRLLTK